MSYLCLLLALGILALAVTYAVRHRNNTTLWISGITFGIFCASFFLVLPTDWGDTTLPFSGRVVSSLLYSFKVIGGRQSIEQLESILLADWVRPLYIALNYICFALAPILTSGLVLSFVGDVSERMRYALRFSSKCYVFSDINQSTLSLAKTILRRPGRKTLVFCNAKNADKELTAAARELGGLLLFRSCTDLRIARRFTSYEFFVLSDDEDATIDLAQLLLTKRAAEKIVVNAFVDSGTNVKFLESVLHEIPDAALELRCVDPIAQSCNHLIYNHPLYDTCTDGVISVAIIGAGRTGLRMLKTIFWAGQIEGHSLKIRVYDKNAETVAEAFRKQCPALKDEAAIRFVNVNVRSDSFETVLMREENSADATYIVTTMGDDHMNLSLADDLFRMFRRRRGFDLTRCPSIFARVRSDAKAQHFIRHTSFLEDRRICLFGTSDSVFAEDTLFDIGLEKLALAVHLAYWGRLDAPTDSDEFREVYKDFHSGEYTRRSSMANALHIPAKLFTFRRSAEGLFTAETVRAFGDALRSDAAFAERLARNEHDRWNAFMATEGYQGVSVEEMFLYADRTGNHKDELSMLHPCLVGWDALDALDDAFFERYGKRKNFKRSDVNIVSNIPRILERARELGDTL